MDDFSGSAEKLVIYVLGDGQVEPTPEECDAIHLSLGVRPPGWPRLDQRTTPDLRSD